MLKNKTLPNLFSYNSKAAALNNSSTRAITKQFMNPNRKYYNSKMGNKTFIEPKTPTEGTSNKTRVFESGSTSRSGGTGEPNYADLKRRVRERWILSSREHLDSNSASKSPLSKSHQNLYSTKITSLTKENAQLKADYEKLKKEMSALDKWVETTKRTVTEQSIKIKQLTAALSQKDKDMERMKKVFEEERARDSKIVEDHTNAENYLLELVDEFTNGMRKIYADDIEFKDVEIEGLPFCERFSNLLYNILLIIDFQKQFIVDKTSTGHHPGAAYYNNEWIIEEADNEEDTENEAQNSNRKYEESEGESEEEVAPKHNNMRLSKASQRQSNWSHAYSRGNMSIHKRSNQQEDDEFSLIWKEGMDSNYQSRQDNDDDSDLHKQYSTDRELTSEEQEPQDEPVVNKTLVMLQKDMHKSLFSPSLMKINESPKISLLTDRSKKSSRYKNTSSEQDPSENTRSRDPTVIINSNVQNPFIKDNIPNIFGMNIRPSSGEVMSPTSESSRRTIRKDHLSKENRYQMQHDDYSDNNSEDLMSLESIVIKREHEHKHQHSGNDSIEEAFTPNFITKRSSVNNPLHLEGEKAESVMFYRHDKELVPYDYRPPLVSVLGSDGHRYAEEEDEFSESMEGSEQVFSSNREDVEEYKNDFRFPRPAHK